jgi:hypothetical protein
MEEEGEGRAMREGGLWKRSGVTDRCWDAVRV